MKSSLLALIGLLAVAVGVGWGSFAVSATPAGVGVGSSFRGPIGLQLYSLRNQFAKNVPRTLDQVRAFGIRYVELAGTYGLTPQAFHGLRMRAGTRRLCCTSTRTASTCRT